MSDDNKPRKWHEILINFPDPIGGELDISKCKCSDNPFTIPMQKEAEIDLVLSKIAKSLKEERKYANLSQNMVGRAVGVSYSQWQKYESGENAISIF